MEYSIKEIAGIIGADAQKLYDAPVSILLTDSRRLSFPEQSLFFALQTKSALFYRSSNRCLKQTSLSSRIH